MFLLEGVFEKNLWFYRRGETYKNMFYGSKNAIDCMLFTDLVSLYSIDYLLLIKWGLKDVDVIQNGCQHF